MNWVSFILLLIFSAVCFGAGSGKKHTCAGSHKQVAKTQTTSIASEPEQYESKRGPDSQPRWNDYYESDGAPVVIKPRQGPPVPSEPEQYESKRDPDSQPRWNDYYEDEVAPEPKKLKKPKKRKKP